MKTFLHWFIGLALALNLASAFAAPPNGKPGKSPPAGASGMPDQRREPDRDDERDRDRDRDSGYRRDDERAGKGQPDRGNERSREMLEQRDERKEAKSEYRSDRVPGQEGKGNNKGQQEEKDADKPWYDIF